MELKNGYQPRLPAREYRVMTRAEVEALRAGERVWFRANDGTARQVTINGQVRRWKRAPHRIEVPVKYGLYEYDRFNEHSVGRFLVPVDEGGA